MFLIFACHHRSSSHDIQCGNTTRYNIESIAFYESLSKMWFEQSWTVYKHGHWMRMGYANPAIVATANYFLDHDPNVNVVMVCRVEQTAFRVTVMSRPGKVNANEIAKLYGGGGSSTYAGFGIPWEEVSAFMK
jgi:DHHA1 domain